MHLWQAIILAVVQGLTEFLPVSSTAHLVLFPWLFHWPDPGLAFDVALHAGTLLAALLFFLREWIELVMCGVGFHYPRRASELRVMQNQRMFWYLAAATIPAGLTGCWVCGDRVLFTVLANTDAHNLHLLPDFVWYSCARTRVPPVGFRAIAPARPTLRVLVTFRDS